MESAAWGKLTLAGQREGEVRGIPVLTPWMFPPGRGCEPGPHSLCDARGEGAGDHGQLSVPGEGQQTQRGQRQRLPRPVVPPQLCSQQVSGTRVTALEILSVRRGACQAKPQSSCPIPILVVTMPQPECEVLSVAQTHRICSPVICVCLLPFPVTRSGRALAP